MSERRKGVHRLLQAIEKQRIVLSSNNDSYLSVECIFDDIDFSYNMTREEFEQINHQFFKEVQNFFQECLQESKLNIADLHSVERIGGGSRIPKIQEVIGQIFGRELSKTLDASESIARGCTIMAAIISPRYQVQAYEIKEYLNYPISIAIQYESEEQSVVKTLFDTGADFNKTLSLSIKKLSTLRFTLYQMGQKLIDCQVDQLKPKHEQFEGKVHIELSKSGVVSVKGVDLIETFQEEEKVGEEVKTKTKTVTTPSQFTFEKFFGISHGDMIKFSQ